MATLHGGSGANKFSSPAKAQTETITALSYVPASDTSPRRVAGVLRAARASHDKSIAKFRDAKLEMASGKIAELRQANRNFKDIIAELHEKSDKFKDTADSEIRVLKSNAWLDEIALQQKDYEIAALKRCLDTRVDTNCQEHAEILNETQKLNLAIIDLSRVKKELMEEIHTLEAKKEDLEFA